MPAHADSLAKPAATPVRGEGAAVMPWVGTHFREVLEKRGSGGGFSGPGALP